MPYNEIDFANLNLDDKILICNRTQGILKAFFPESDFTIRKDSLDDGLKFYKKLITDFKGQCIVDNTAVIFFKKVELKDPFDRFGEFRRIRNERHKDGGNCMFIDFLVADLNEDNLKDINEFLFRDWRIEYYMMQRRGEIILKTRRDLEVLVKRVKNFSLISSLSV